MSDARDRVRREVVTMCPRQMCREHGRCMADAHLLNACRLRPPLDELAKKETT